MVSTPQISIVIDMYQSIRLSIFGLLPPGIFEGFLALFGCTDSTPWSTVGMLRYVPYRAGLGILVHIKIENHGLLYDYLGLYLLSSCCALPEETK